VSITSFPLSAILLAIPMSLGLVTAGCSNPSGGVQVAEDAAAGGAVSKGGSGGNSGVSAAGGTSASGGTIGTGGVPSSGGTSASGGSAASGGTPATGGSTVISTGGAGGLGGAISTGGVKASGGAGGTTVTVPDGAVDVDGPMGTGGTKPAGGATATGGKVGSGGANGSGGAVATGGGVGMGGSTVGPTTTATIPGKGCTPPSAYNNLFVSLSGHTQADSDAKVAAAWSKLFNPKGPGNIYFDGPGSDESYVKDIYNGDVRTEGMGYGMVIAAELDHQTEFDRLWKWVKTHMANGTGEISWQCSTSGSKMSGGGAPDGEEYMATALIFAHNRWGDTSGKFNYATEAQWVLDLIRTKYFNSQYHIVKFVSGSNNTDASYILPAFYQVWACCDTTNKAFWDSSVTAARDFFHVAIDGSGVIPDQSSWTGGTVKGATVDWIRCVMNIMMDWNFFAADTWQTETYATKFAAHEKNAGASAQGFCDSTLGFGLPAASGKAFVDKIWSAGIPTSYWDGTLYMLALLHVSGTFHLWY